MQEQPKPARALPAEASTLDGTDWLLYFWALLYFVSAVLSLGLSQALQGAWVGLDFWIDQLQWTAALLAQSTAVFSCVLLVHCSLVLVRRGPPLGLWLTMAALGAVPTLVVMAAQPHILPPGGALISSSFACLLWLFLAARKTQLAAPSAGWFWLWSLAWGAKTVSASSARSGDLSTPSLGWAFGPLGTELLAGLAQLLALLLALGLSVAWARRSSRPAWAAAGLLTASLLLARAATASSFRDAHGAVLLVGRTVSELCAAQGSLLGAFPVTLTLLLSVALFARRSARGAVLGILCLSLWLPVSPLSAAALALGALGLARESRLPSPLGANVSGRGRTA